MRGLHICISAGARGAAANRNAVIMDALPATVVQQRETGEEGMRRIERNEMEKEGNGISNERSMFPACFARRNENFVV